MNDNIFNQQALDKLRSPEKLDTMIRITGPVGWMGTASVALLCLAIVLWSFYGSFTEKAEGRGLILDSAGVVSEGSTNISGGQRQRILIAKALAMNPAIVICDEATSALDNRTQAIVTDSLDRLKVTRIVVAHRLSTIRHADRILVLDEGHIAESGSFDELMEKDGLFASFVKRQVA